MRKLKNKVTVVTGAGAGIGREIALLFASHGSMVIATDIDPKRLATLKLESSRGLGQIFTYEADMANAKDIENMINLAVKKWGTIDILVNNAGIMDNFQSAGELTSELYNKIMQVNVDGPLRAIRSALPVFVQKKKGVIINIASLGGINGARAGAAYTMSKHALVGLTRNTSYMYAQSGIRCNAIAPGAVKTRIGETISPENMSELAKKTIIPGISQNPVVLSPEAIAKVALFLASDDSAAINGETVVADGGWNAY